MDSAIESMRGAALLDAASSWGGSGAGTAMLQLYPIAADFRRNDGFPAGKQMEYPVQHMASTPEAKATPPQRRSRWLLLLALPYVGLCFPQLYARSTPTLWGFPFFYWYQFAWVILASALLGIVHRKLKT
jgi:hypothetical protein